MDLPVFSDIMAEITQVRQTHCSPYFATHQGSQSRRRARHGTRKNGEKRPSRKMQTSATG